MQHSIGSLSQNSEARKRKKKHPDWKGKSKTVTTYRLHIVSRKPERLLKKTVRINK